VDASEVEAAFGRPHVIVPAKAALGEKRWKLFGTSTGGRFLVVVFTIRGGLLRPVTAHAMNRNEREIYGPEIERAS